MSNNRAEEKEKTDQKEEKGTGGDNGRSKTKRTTKTKSRCKLSSLRKVVSKNKRRRLKLTPCSPIPTEDSESKEGRIIF